MQLSDVAIRKAKPREKPYKLSDGRGLYLLVYPNGRRGWRLKFRWLGKEQLLSLGPYPDVSLSTAREKCDESRRLLAQGINPSDARRSAKLASALNAASTFEAIAREWFQTNLTKWVPDHANRTLRRLERHVFPWLGKRPIVELTAADFLPHLRRVEQTGALETTHRVLNLCSQVMRYGVATARLTHDPTVSLRGALATPTVRHFSTVTDPSRLGELLAMMDGYGGTLTVRCALRLAPLVFVRPGELRKARWQDINLDNAEWTFTSPKKGVPLVVPLATQAIAIFRELQPLTANSEYVFPSARSHQRPMSNMAVLAALRRLGVGKDELCGHGFRASARTIMDEVLGLRPDLIEHQLTHVVRGPLGRAYTRTQFL
ncbi:MAG: DUF4102 domain-containing protein, partial [Gammaproteobacteria bacterium]|nr:DUF4102 domain-containing protein [Gammaproteobacteria bacterium]